MASESHRSAKNEIRDLLDRLPENATWEDIQYHIYVQQKIRKGLADVEGGRTVSAEDAEKRLSKWLEP